MTTKTELAKVALAFCREVIGIKKAAHDKSLKAITVRNKAAGIGYRVVLRYTDLNAVMAAVESWCIEQQVDYEVNVTFNARTSENRRFTVYIERRAKPGSTPDSENRWNYYE